MDENMCMYALPLTTSLCLTPLSGYWLQKLINIFSRSWFSSVQSLSRVWLFATPQTAACHTSPSIPTHEACSNSAIHPTISSSVIPFSSCLQSCPVSRSFQMSQFFASGGQSTGVSASASVLPMNIQDWFPIGLTGWISLQSKGLSSVFSNTTVQKRQFFSTQLSLWFNSHYCDYVTITHLIPLYHDWSTEK